MRTTAALGILVGGCLVLPSACFYAPHPGDGALACSIDGRCPEGYFCGPTTAGERRCFVNGGPDPRVDGGAATGGRSGTGGALAGTGAAPGSGSGGSTATGGLFGTGGMAVGGRMGSGGRGIGGFTGSGGRGTGGSSGTGGAGTGGRGTGGVSATGGRGTGGVLGTGGRGTGGRGTGGMAAGEPSLASCIEVDHDDIAACGTCTIGSPVDATVYGLAFSPDSSLMVSGGTDGRLKVWRVVNRTVVPEGHVLNGTSDAISAFSPNGSLLAVGRAGSIEIWNVATWAQQTTLTISGSVYGIAFTPDGSQLVSIDDSTLYVHGMGAPAPAHTVAVPNAWALAVAPVTTTAGSVAVAVATLSGTALVFNLTAAGFSNPVRLNVTSDSSTTQGIAFSPQGTLLAAGGDDGFLHFWNQPISGMPMPPNIDISASTNVFSEEVKSVAFSPTGSYVAVGGGLFGAVVAWASAPPRALLGAPYEGPQSDVVSVAISPDGTVIAGGELDCGCVVVCPQ